MVLQTASMELMMTTAGYLTGQEEDDDDPTTNRRKTFALSLALLFPLYVPNTHLASYPV